MPPPMESGGVAFVRAGLARPDPVRRGGRHIYTNVYRPHTRRQPAFPKVWCGAPHGQWLRRAGAR